MTRLLQRVPPLVVWLAAAALEIASIDTGWIVIDEFAARFVYFYTGYILAGPIFWLAGLRANMSRLRRSGARGSGPC